MVVKKSIRYFKFTTKYLNINLEKHTLLFSIISQFLKKSSSMTKNLTNLKLMLEELNPTPVGGGRFPPPLPKNGNIS